MHTLLGVSLWRWSVALLGVVSLASALILSWTGASAWGGCLSGLHAASLGHCPLCWVAIAAFLAAGLPAAPRRLALKVRAPRA